MACDLEEEEGGDGEMTGDELFGSEHGTSVNTTPATTPLPPIDMLVDQVSVFMEPEPKTTNMDVITEQVTGLQEHQRPGSELAGVSVVTEQPVRSDPPPIVRADPLPQPIRCVSLIYIKLCLLYYMYVHSLLLSFLYIMRCFLSCSGWTPSASLLLLLLPPR